MQGAHQQPPERTALDASKIEWLVSRRQIEGDTSARFTDSLCPSLSGAASSFLLKQIALCQKFLGLRGLGCLDTAVESSESFLGHLLAAQKRVERIH